MPGFAFWNVERLGGGSSEDKRMIIESVIAEIHRVSPVSFVGLCEVTSDVRLGEAPVSRQVYRAKRTQDQERYQLAYSAFDTPNMSAVDLEIKSIMDFRDLFVEGRDFAVPGGGVIRGVGRARVPGGGKTVFVSHSARPVADAGELNGTRVFLYHADSGGGNPPQRGFLAAWVAASLDLEYGGNFVLAGDLNCAHQ